MSDIKYVDLDGLSHFKAKTDNEYVKKVAGKGLSTEDYTTAEKTKLSGIEDNAEVNIIESVVVNGTTATISNKTASVTIQAGAIDSISVNGTAQTIDANKNVDITVPTKVSDLTNDSGFITNAVNNLTNYYKKSETYTQAEVNNLIGAISSLTIQIVQTLPTQDISTSTIYFVPKSTSETNNIYNEYVYVNNAWELIGTTEIDLSGYVQVIDLTAITNAEIDTIFES